MTKPVSKRHWIKWDPKWWLEDKNLQACSLAAKGLWISILMHMHGCEPYGHLKIAGSAPDLASIARLVGSTPTEVKAALAELEAHGVPSRTTDGVLFSRRMVKDEAAWRAAQANGARGGNPKLRDGDNPGGYGGGITPGDNPPPNPLPNPSANPQAVARARAHARSSESEKGNSSTPSHLNGTHTSRNARARDEAPPDRLQGMRPVNEHDAFWEWWCERYAQLTAVPAMPAGARYPDTPAEHVKANEVLRLARQSGSGLEVAKAQAERFFAHPTFGKEAPTLGRLVATWATLFETRAEAAPKPSSAARDDVGAERRAVERAWHAKHETDLEVPKPGGGVMRVRGPDRPFPGHEEAKAELLADQQANPPRSGAA